MKTFLFSSIPGKGSSCLPLAGLIVAVVSISMADENESGAAVSEPALIAPKTEVNSIGMKLVQIPAGEFLMGRGETPDALIEEFESATKFIRFFVGERPQHLVRISRPFLLGAHEVTVGEFRQFVEDTGYQTVAEHDGLGSLARVFGAEDWELNSKCTWRAPGYAQTENHPVVGISWNDAVVFCEWLSRKEGKKYRLPTEAEWEYACRAGTVTRFHHGDDPERVVQVANVCDGSIKTRFPGWRTFIQQSDDYLYAAPVGTFDPNAWGLFDMHGNALEWCHDWYAPDYYLRSPAAQDPQGPKSGTERVVRGGSYQFRPLACRSAFRAGHVPGSPLAVTGFRVVREP